MIKFYLIKCVLICLFVMGNDRIYFPVALKTALAMAGAIPTMEISPKPFEPIG
ncbi:MAG: hypothetical protein ABIN67_17285 [Ferruginibacter sp.]